MDDTVELLLHVTPQYKAAMAAENVVCESSQSRCSDTLYWYQEQYLSSEEAMAMSKDFPHKKHIILKDMQA